MFITAPLQAAQIVVLALHAAENERMRRNKPFHTRSLVR